MERRHPDPDRRAQHRALILEHVVAGDVGVDEAARILGLSTRQVGRLLARYVADPMDLVHGNRGRAPANRIPADTRAQLVKLARTRYAGVNHAHLAELLAEREGIIVAERTLRRILDEAEYDELARALRCSPSVARKRVSRGLRTLRQRLEEQP